MSLYPKLLEAFSRTGEPTEPAALKDRPLIAFAPQSTLGLIHLKLLQNGGAHFVLAVDDYCRDKKVDGVPVTNTAGFLARKDEFKDAIAIDFSQSAYAQAYYAELARQAGCELRDALQAVACFDSVSVYQTARQYRALTQERADDWLQFAQRLADEQSRETLYGVLLQRLEYDRHWIQGVRISGRDEYFGQAQESDTFVLGSNEHFVDCGAHRGTILQKLLGVTNWRYGHLHAFEPDAENFAAMQKLYSWALERCSLHPYAVADENKTLRFHQTGTMGSHISESGDVAIECVRVDAKVDQASFIKLDVEGFEAAALRGASGVLNKCRPRLAVASYHYAADLLDIAKTVDELVPGYTFFLRHHFGYFYDTILYATPRQDWLPLAEAM